MLTTTGASIGSPDLSVTPATRPSARLIAATSALNRNTAPLRGTTHFTRI